MSGSDRRILVGVFGRAVGLKGELRLKSYTGDPDAIAGYTPLSLKDGRAIELVSVRPVAGTADMLVAKVKGVASREAAEPLNRAEVFVPREALPDVDEDEFFQADLVGLAVEGPDGAPLGIVVGLANYGAGDILEIRPSRGATALVPFRDPFVPVVDVPGGRIVINDAGLLAPADPAERGGEGE